MAPEKLDAEAAVTHLEQDGRLDSTDLKGDALHVNEERAPEAQGRDAAYVPVSYWFSPKVLGSFVAIGCGFAAPTGGFALVAPLLGTINEDIGPSDNIPWVALVYLVCQAVFVLIVGRLTDVFGRGWFFIVGSLIGLLGTSSAPLLRT